MFFCYAFVVVSLLNCLHDFHVSSDDICAVEPVFTPSRLVVKYGDPTSATCLACQDACPNDLFGLEKSLGNITTNGSTILWKVGSMTEWGTSAICYYTDVDEKQCQSILPITVYQPPKNVHLSFLHHSGPMFAGHQYTLQCTVQEVAPIGDLNVIFYRGRTELGQRKVNDNSTKTPVTEIFTLDIKPSKEDDGGLYWCEAKLNLGAEGPQPPPAMASQTITATVYYKPLLKGSSHPDPITITAGDPLHLNCSAEGNPSPSYTWTLPSNSRSPFNGSTLAIESATSMDKGEYICSVHNGVGTVTVKFNVDVKENYTYMILAIVLAVVLLAFIVIFSVVMYQYKHNRMGRYNLKAVFRFPSRHVALPTGE